jgi:hypothetical protein
MKKLLAACAATLLAWLAAAPAHALPLFARQTGQRCVMCHAGGQFPELTPFGRNFKLNGYTLGERQDIPLAAMAVLTNTRVASTSTVGDPAVDFAKNGSTILAQASLFTGGKITDNIGAFVQISHDPYATVDETGHFAGHTSLDELDVRYANRILLGGGDTVVGVTVNNNPSLSDPWNTAPAWMQYVPVPSPSSSQFIDGAAPYPGYSAGDPLAGISAYAFWNNAIYAELGLYRGATGALRLFSAGVPRGDVPRIQGTAPYWRLAWNGDWGASHLMVGTSGMRAKFWDDPLDTADPATIHRTRDVGFDAMYQYLADPHTITVQLARMHTRDDFQGEVAGSNVTRSKFTYVYQATYGGSLGTFNGTADGGTRGATAELFWIPIQYMRLGVQFTRYNRFMGAAANYDGNGRNARDNNSTFLYLWAAY